MLDEGVAARELVGDEALVGLEHEHEVRGLVLFQVGEHARDLLGGNGAVDDAQLEELTGELLGGFVVGGHRGGKNQTTVSSRAAAWL
jgi:hypothetical protein